eukprot:4584506-Prymnesium_polylepis.1
MRRGRDSSASMRSARGWSGEGCCCQGTRSASSGSSFGGSRTTRAGGRTLGRWCELYGATARRR